MPIPIHLDTIHLTNSPISTGGNSAGNGGAGVSTGAITTTAAINFAPVNNATGADVHVPTSDHVTQTAGGIADSSSGVTSTVHTDTTAYQTNFLAADLSQSVAAGIGGNGGDGNNAVGGDVLLHV